MSTTYVVTGVDAGIPSLANDSVIAGLKVGDTFTSTLDGGVEAELIAAGLIAKSPVSSPVVMLSDGTLKAQDGRTFSGGSGSPETRDSYSLLFSAVPASTYTNLAWTLNAGIHHDALLDLTDPTNPTVKAAGVYAVTVGFQCSDANTFEAGKGVLVELDLDLNGDDASCQNALGLDPAADFGQGWRQSLTVTYYVPAGGVVAAIIWHTLTASISGGGNATVQRLS